MRIAIVDDGIDKKALLHPEYIKKRISLKKKTIQNDVNGHGTVCAQTLERCAKDYEIVSVEMVDKWDTPASVQQLVDALEICLHEEVELICLSVGTEYLSEYRNMQSVIEKIEKAGILTIAALGNDGKLTLPAAFDSVICAMMDWQQRLLPGACTLVSHPFLGDMVVANLQVFPGQKIFKKGNSFAVSVVAGKCISLMQSGIKVVSQNLAELFPKENDEKKLVCETWGQEEKNPVVLLEGMTAVELIAFLDNLIWKHELETVVAVSGSWYPKNDLRFLDGEKYGKNREALLTAIDAYVDCSLIISAYPKIREETDQWEYDLEIYDKEKEVWVCKNGKVCKVILKAEEWAENLSACLIEQLS